MTCTPRFVGVAPTVPCPEWLPSVRVPAHSAIVACVFSLALSGCAAHKPLKFQPPPAWAHCRVWQQIGQSVFLSCPAQSSYTAGPLGGSTLVEMDVNTKRVIQVRQ